MFRLYFIVLVCGVIMTYVTPWGHFVNSSTVLQKLKRAGLVLTIHTYKGKQVTRYTVGMLFVVTKSCPLSG